MTAAAESSQRRAYALVTGAYWADTLTDGALRVIVLFAFYERGYSALAVASLFLFYEVFGIVTNLVGGWLAARLGLRATLVMGLTTQLVALTLLVVAPDRLLVVPYVMAAQALSGIAKDLTKMSAKSAVRLLVRGGEADALFRWVALLTGSKNAVKGVGFFVGGVLLTTIGFRPALGVLVALVAAALAVTVILGGPLGEADPRARFRAMFSQTRAVNVLAAARLLLFAARDVWFVVAVPVFLRTEVGWSFWQVGAFLALWVIGYGAVQAAAPALLRAHGTPAGATAAALAAVLAVTMAALAVTVGASSAPGGILIAGLIAFGVVFALNSGVHSFLILHYATDRRVAMNVGFYYMANAGGRLLGTVLSGALYDWRGLGVCLWAATALAVAAATLSLALPRARDARTQPPSAANPAEA
jgi:hypothetical protein